MDALTRRLFQDLALLGPALLLERLVPKEKVQPEYLQFDRQNARNFLLLRLLTEVQKVGFVIKRWNEFLDRDRESPSTNRGKQMLESLVDEQSLWQRKLCEGLVLLINFASTNDLIFYHHLLLLNELQRYRGILKEQKDFFQYESALTRKTVGFLTEQIAAVENEIGALSKCWYLPASKPGRKRKQWPVLASLRQQLKCALTTATRREKGALAYTYELGYGETSGNIHFNITRLDYSAVGERFSFGLAQCGLLTLAILQRAHDLTDVKPEGINAQIMRVERNLRSESEPTVKRLETGDFVFANGPYLGEIVDIATSAFGYESYLVKYLADTPLEGIDEAWCPSVEIQLFMKRNETMERALTEFQKSTKDAGVPTESLSDEELRQATQEAVVELWQAGFGTYTKRVAVPKRTGDMGLGYKPGNGRM